MALIVIGSPKGGVGKSTTALVLGQVLAEKGHKTCLLEYDKNRPLGAWQERAQERGYDKPLKIISSFKDPNELLDTAQKESAENDFTIIDFPGQAQMSFLLLAQLADIVLVPMKETFLDAEQAGSLISMLKTQESISKRKINYKVVLSATENIKTKEARAIDDNLERGDIPVLPVSLPRRAAFSAIFACSLSLYQLEDEVKNPDKIREIAENFTKAVVNSIKGN